MSKTIWISCSKVVHYKQQRTVTDEEYEKLKHCELWDIDQIDDEEEVEGIWEILEDYINQSNIYDTDTEYLSVQIEEDNKK